MACADPAAHQRMTEKFLLDVFGGSGFVANATKHFGLAWICARHKKFGPRYGVTKPLVLARIRQDASAGTSVAAMISPPRRHTLCSSHVILGSASVANLLQGARMPWILEHTCDPGLSDVSKLRTLSAQPRTAWPWRIIAFSVHSTEIVLCFWLVMWTAEICTVLLANVLGRVDVAVCQDKNVSIHHHAQKFYSSLDHTRPARLSFALAMIPTMNSQRFQKTHPLRGVGSSLSASKGYWYGSC